MMRPIPNSDICILVEHVLPWYSTNKDFNTNVVWQMVYFTTGLWQTYYHLYSMLFFSVFYVTASEPTIVDWEKPAIYSLKTMNLFYIC